MLLSFYEKLRRSHAEVVSLLLIGLHHHLVHFCGVDFIFVGYGWKTVEHLFAFRALLFIAEDYVDPLVEVLRNVIALEAFPGFLAEKIGIILGPFRQLNFVDLLPCVFLAEVQVLQIQEGFRESEDLGYELPDV